MEKLTLEESNADMFFKQLYLNKYVCLEDWINRISRDYEINEEQFWKFINNSFELSKYCQEEDFYVNKYYKQFEMLENDLTKLSEKIINKIKLKNTPTSNELERLFNDLLDSNKERIESDSELQESVINQLERILKSNKNAVINSMKIQRDKSLEELLEVYIKKLREKDLYFQKLYCLFFYKKVEINILGNKRTYVYYPNSEKIFIVGDFLVFQKLIKYLDDIKDKVQTVRNTGYLKSIKKSIRKMKKYFDKNEVSVDYPMLDTPQSRNELLRIIELINYKNIKKSDRNVLFYRGHSDSNYSLVPSISRNSNLIGNEHNYYHETIVRCNDFFITSKHRLEILTLMQHYSIPTRLLDISKNPLSALYFAVSDGDSYDGEIVVFCAKENEIKYYHSDTVEILSTLSVLHYDEKKDLEDLIIKITKKLVIQLSEQMGEDGELEAEILDAEIKKLTKEFNDEYVVGKLVHEIAKRNSHFQNNINPFQLYNSYFVLPILNNSRIIRQSGAFMITGFNNKMDAQKNIYSHRYHLPTSFDDYNEEFSDDVVMEKLKVIESSISIENKDRKLFANKYKLFMPTLSREIEYAKDPKKLKKVKIIIHSKDNKKEYSDWLNTFDINQATVYPEIEKVGAYLNSKYNI